MAAEGLQNGQFTEYLEDLIQTSAGKFPGAYCREDLRYKYDKMLRLRGTSGYLHRKRALVNTLRGCNLVCSIQDGDEYLGELIDRVPGREEQTRQLLAELKDIYHAFPRPEDYMRRLIGRLADPDFRGDPPRTAIVKQFLRHTDYGTAPVAALIRKQAGLGEDAPAEKVIDAVDEGLFDVLERPLSDDEQKKVRLLRLADNLAFGKFRTNGSTRRDLYMFAFAFGMKWYPDPEEPDYDAGKDIEKNLFHDYYQTNLLQYISSFDGKGLNAFDTQPTGEGINYKSFAEVIYLYYLGQAGKDARSRIRQAEKAIEACLNQVRAGRVAGFVQAHGDPALSGGTLRLRILKQILAHTDADCREIAALARKKYQAPESIDRETLTALLDDKIFTGNLGKSRLLKLCSDLARGEKPIYTDNEELRLVAEGFRLPDGTGLRQAIDRLERRRPVPNRSMDTQMYKDKLLREMYRLHEDELADYICRNYRIPPEAENMNKLMVHWQEQTAFDRYTCVLQELNALPEGNGYAESLFGEESVGGLQELERDGHFAELLRRMTGLLKPNIPQAQVILAKELALQGDEETSQRLFLLSSCLRTAVNKGKSALRWFHGLNRDRREVAAQIREYAAAGKDTAPLEVRKETLYGLWQGLRGMDGGIRELNTLLARAVDAAEQHARFVRENPGAELTFPSTLGLLGKTLQQLEPLLPAAESLRQELCAEALPEGQSWYDACVPLLRELKVYLQALIPFIRGFALPETDVKPLLALPGNEAILKEHRREFNQWDRLGRTDLIAVYYHYCLLDEAGESVSMPELLERFRQLADPDLEACRYQKISEKNLFDMFAVFSLYHKINFAPEG